MNFKVTKSKFSTYIDIILSIKPDLHKEILESKHLLENASVIEIEAPLGKVIFENGKLNKELYEYWNSEGFDYSSFPLMMVISGEFELFLGLETKNKIGVSSIPVAHAKPGDILGVFETCDEMLGSPASLSTVKPWSLFSGKKTSVILNYKKVPLKRKLSTPKLPYRTINNNSKNHSKVIYSLLNNLEFPNKLQSQSKIVIFSKKIVEEIFNNSSTLRFELLKTAWIQSKHIRDNQLLNIRWSELAIDFEENGGFKIDEEALEYIKNIIMAGNGLAPVFVRSSNPLESLAEEEICKLEDGSLIFTTEILDENSAFNSGYLPLKFHFSRTERSFFKEPQGGETYIRKLEKIQAAFSLLQNGDFGFNEKFKVEFFCNKAKAHLPEGIRNNIEAIKSDIHFKQKCKSTFKLLDNSKSHSCNIHDDFLFVFTKITKLNAK